MADGEVAGTAATGPVGLITRSIPSPTDGRVWRERGALSPHTARLLRQARLDRGLGLRQAARLAGVNPGYLSRLERGLRRPSRGVARRLVWVLGLDDDGADRLLAESVDSWRVGMGHRGTD